MKVFISIFLFFILIFSIIEISSCDNETFVNQKFIIKDKENYRFLLAKIDTLPDTFFTVITDQNYKLHKNLWWDRVYYSKQLNDTLVLDYISKKRFWHKLK
jgi:hypothetical protein